MATKDDSFDEICMIVGTFCFTQAFNDSEDDRKTMVDELEDVIVMGKVILTITPLYDWGRPTI